MSGSQAPSTAAAPATALPTTADMWAEYQASQAQAQDSQSRALNIPQGEIGLPYVPTRQDETPKLPTTDEVWAQYHQQRAVEAGQQMPVGSVLGMPVPINKGAIDYYGNTAVGRILHAIGHGLAQPWTAGRLGLSDQSVQALTKAGIFNDWSKGDANILRTFNEAVMAPAAAALDAVVRAGQSVVGAAKGGVAQTATEMGAPQLGRALAGMIEAGTTNPAAIGLPMVPPVNIPMARDMGVVGETEGAFEGTTEPHVGERPSATEAHLEPAQEPIPTVPETTAQEGAAASAPSAQGAPEAATATQQAAEATAPADVHALARQIDPVTFDEYDALSQHRDDLSSQIRSSVQALHDDAVAQAPNAAAIERIQSKLDDPTIRPKERARRQAQLAKLMPAYEEFLRDDFTIGALMRDTPEVAALREQLLETDFRMRDLAPQVSAAYAEAAKQMPAPPEVEAPVVEGEAVPGAQAPVEAAEPAAGAGETAAPPTEAPTAQEEASAGAIASPLENVSPEQTAAVAPETTPKVEPVANIAEDVSQKLQAAGRSKEEADAAGTVTAALYRVRAARFNGALGTPEEMYAREAPEIRGERAPTRAREMAQGERTLNQSGWSNKSAETERLRDRVADAATKMGLSVSHDNSRISASRYLTVSDDASDREPLKIRISDHDDHYGGSDVHLYTGENPASTIEKIAAHFAKSVPEDHTTEAYARRSKAALTGAQTARLRAHHAEQEMLSEITERLRASPRRSAVAAGKIVDELFPDASRAQRQRLAHGAAYRVSRTLTQEARGKIRLTDNGRAVITLMRSANASTFLHEMGHDWLERMMRDAADPRASDDLKADAATVRKYLGVNDAGEITTRAHEKFARSFERYFMEGRAPSAALASVFAKFKLWLTNIYQTVAKLRAPITADIRDVFDRMLATPEERETAIVPETTAEREFKPSPMKPATTRAIMKPPKEPMRLVAFLRKIGGVNDEGGDIAHSLGRGRVLPGLIRADGLPLDEAALEAWENGYFSGDERPTINDLRDAIHEDLNGEPQYSANDAEAVTAYHDALAHNAEVERLASEWNIDTTKMTYEEFREEVSKRAAQELQDRQQQEIGEHEVEFRDARDDAIEDVHEHNPDATPDEIYGIEEPRTEAELEAAHGQANAARPNGQGATVDVEPATSGQRAGDGAEGVGTRESGAPAGRGVEGQGGTGSEERPGPGNTLVTPEAKSRVDAQEPFGDAESSAVDKAGNIRLDNINSTEDVNDVLRTVAAQNKDFIEARRGIVSDADVQSLADAMGVQASAVNIDRLRQISVEDGMPLAARILAARQLLVASARAVHAAMIADDAVAYADAVTRHLRIQETVSGVTAEWGRAGRAFRKMATEAARAQELSRFLERNLGKTLFQVNREMKAGAVLDDSAQVAKFVNDAEKPTFADKLLEYWINCLISGPITHKSILVGEIALATMRAVPETITSAAIGSVRAALGDAGPRVQWGEVPAQVAALVRGQRDAVHAAWKAAKSGMTEPLPGEMVEDAQVTMLAVQPTMRKAIGNVGPVPVGEIVRLPSRGIAAMHSYVRSMSYAQAIAQLAFQQASKEGLSGVEAWARAAELNMNPSRAMMDAAVTQATEQALMGRGGEFTERLSALANTSFAGVPLRFVMPFVRIASNVARQALLERSPLGVLDAGIRDNLIGRNGPIARDMQIGRIIVGSTIAGAVATLAMQGLMTGGGPSVPNERRLWLLTHQPYSVNIGGVWHEYARLGPLGKIMGVAADVQELGTALPQETVDQVAWNIVGGVARNMLDDSFMRGPSELLQAIEDPQRYGARYVTDTLTSFMPFSVGVSQIAREDDPFVRQARDLISAFKRKIPGVSQQLPPEVDVWGNPIHQAEFAGLAELVFSQSEPVRHDPVADKLMSLGMYPALPKRLVRGVTLTPQQYAEYAAQAGRLAHMRLQQAVGQPSFGMIPRGQQVQIIREIISSSRQYASDVLFTRHPDLMREAYNNKLTILRTGKRPAP